MNVNDTAAVMTDEERDAALAALHRVIRGCDRCVQAGWIPVAHPIVRGGVDHRLMAIGQAPGAHAHEHPQPYSGAFGETLRRWLVRAGFPADVIETGLYRTSLTKCFPGGSATGKGDRAPSSAEIALCRDHLEGEIGLVRPRVVLALGRLAAVTLLRPARPAPLVDLVGSIRPGERAGQHFLVVPLPHPSGVSRWLNDSANQERLDMALALLSDLRVSESL